MKNKTILYVLDFNLTDINGSQHLQVSLIEDILQYSYKITLIQPYKKDFKLPDNLLKYKNLKIFDVCKKSYNKNNLLKRAISTRDYINKVINTIINEQIEFDYVYFLSTPIAHYFVEKIKVFTNKPLIFHIQDLYPDVLKTTMPAIFKSIIYLLNKKQNKALNKVDQIIVISKDIKEVLIQKGIEKSKIHMIPNWFWNIENIKHEDNQFLNKFQLKKKGFIIQYAGNFGRALDYNAIIEFAKKIERYQDIKIHFIGDGSKEYYFKELVKKSKIKNIIFFPMQPFEMVKDINSYADICFISLKNNVIYHSVPSKASIAHALGIPTLFILNKESKYAVEIERNKVGRVFNYNKIDNAVEFVLELKNNKDIYECYKRQSIIYSSRLRRNINTDKIIKLFNN